MEYVHHLLSVIVPSIITVLVIFIVTILHRARRMLLIRKDSNSTHQKAEKIPQENDERFATGKSFIIYGSYHKLFNRCIQQLTEFRLILGSHEVLFAQQIAYVRKKEQNKYSCIYSCLSLSSNGCFQSLLEPRIRSRVSYPFRF